MRALLRVGRKPERGMAAKQGDRRENIAACFAPLLWLRIERAGGLLNRSSNCGRGEIVVLVYKCGQEKSNNLYY